LITAVRFPSPDQAAYIKFRNPASRFALVGVMVARTGKTVRVAVTGAADSVFRAPALEQALAPASRRLPPSVKMDPSGSTWTCMRLPSTARI
jgi:carbon-monoxide dehydrogenase medium subunit